MFCDVLFVNISHVPPVDMGALSLLQDGHCEDGSEEETRSVGSSLGSMSVRTGRRKETHESQYPLAILLRNKFLITSQYS